MSTEKASLRAIVGRLKRALRSILPIAISVFSLGVALAAWHEARRSNDMNAERVRLVVRPDWRDRDAVGAPECGYTLFIPLTWQVLLYNNSNQPVTIESISTIGFSSYGTVIPVGRDQPPAPLDGVMPITIAPKAFSTLSTVVGINAPRAYGDWYRRSGLCENKALNADKVRELAGFTATGGTSKHPSHAGVAVKVTTSDGFEVSTQVEWDQPIDMGSGANVALPRQQR